MTPAQHASGVNVIEQAKLLVDNLRKHRNYASKLDLKELLVYIGSGRVTLEDLKLSPKDLADFERKVNMMQAWELIDVLSRDPRADYLQELQALIGASKVTFEEAKLTPEHLANLARKVDIVRARHLADKINKKEADTSWKRSDNLQELQALIGASKVTLEEIGLSREQYDGLEYAVYVARAKCLTYQLRCSFDCLNAARLRHLVDDKKVTLEEIGLSREQYDCFMRRL